jgi:hypothetical protein
MARVRVGAGILLGFALLALPLGQAGAHGDDNTAPLVVRADGPISKLLVVGKPLPRQDHLQLGPADRVTLMFPSGTRVLTGPGLLHGEVYTPGAAMRRSERSRLAGTRGLDPTKDAPAENQSPPAPEKQER